MVTLSCTLARRTDESGSDGTCGKSSSIDPVVVVVMWEIHGFITGWGEGGFLICITRTGEGDLRWS